MKTIIYVDGYNLFYGCLKHSRHKWLDLHTLFAGHILKAQCPDAALVSIKYFTAPIKTKVASQGNQALAAQQSYHRALELLYPDQIEIIHGYYSLEKAKLLAHKQPPDKAHRVDVWKLEEKQTDVNIALTAYRDAITGRAEQLVFVSNDTDIEPALMAIREDLGDTRKLGVVIPMRKPHGNTTRRPANQRLSDRADWTRSHITDEELANSQLPEKIPTRKKPIIKPAYW
ncbi:MAG: NYN domain-containing protein [Pseudomonadota bacterium]